MIKLSSLLRWVLRDGQDREEVVEVTSGFLSVLPFRSCLFVSVNRGVPDQDQSCGGPWSHWSRV